MLVTTKAYGADPSATCGCTVVKKLFVVAGSWMGKPACCAWVTESPGSQNVEGTLIWPFSVVSGVILGGGMVTGNGGQAWERNDMNVYEGCNV